MLEFAFLLWYSVRVYYRKAKVIFNMVKKVDIIKSLKELGIEDTDTVLVHSSLKSLGTVDGGADTVIDAFLSVLSEGTLVMPTFSQKNWENVYNDWHMDKPSDTGMLTEIFRKREESLRSDQETHSVAAMGKKAKEITEGHKAFGPRTGPFGNYAFSHSSPWEKMYNLGTKIIFIGVSMRYNTFKHYAEHLFAENALNKIKGHEAYQKFEDKLQHYMEELGEHVWPYVSGEKLQAEFDAAGFIKKTSCGNAELLCINAKETVDYILYLMNREPEKWLIFGTYEWLLEIEKTVNNI